VNATTRATALLIADDDPDDRLLVSDAIAECGFICDPRFVEDGEQLLDYLRRKGPFADSTLSPRPGLILLDLNMPKKDGREVLREIKEDAGLRLIPVVVLTTSTAESDVEESYELGANSYIVKPDSFTRLVVAMKVIGKYWFELVEPPPAKGGA